jgi:DNA damage-inducible protein 1
MLIHPVFARVHMLYVNTEVNDVPVKAFVDSGAQATIMSPDCAERCGIMRLMDTRYSGMARGVGTARILGRVHHAEIKIGGAVMPCAFTVMEGKDVDLLFGLDMLKRYKAKIDLDKNALCFEGLEVPFLPESEIPKGFEEGPTVPGPNNTKISTTSGAIKPANDPDGNLVTVGNPSAPSSSQSVQPQPLATQTPAPPSDPYPPQDVDQLVGLGFPRQDAIQALQATGGNVEFAASLLFSQQ